MTKVTTGLISSLEKNMISKNEKLQKTVDDSKEYAVKQDKISREHYGKVQEKAERDLKKKMDKVTSLIISRLHKLETLNAEKAKEQDEKIDSILQGMNSLLERQLK